MGKKPKTKLESPFLRSQARVEMASLMDVMFLVLVFFGYAVSEMAVHRGVKVSLPDAAGSREPGERIVVTIAADDSLSLDGAPMPREALVAAAARKAAANPGAPVLLSADAKASLGAGIELLAALKAAGVDKASFQTSGRAGGGAGR